MNDQPPPHHPTRREKRVKRKKRKHVRRHHSGFGIWRLLSTFLLMVLLVMAGLSVTGRSLIMPGWVTKIISARVNDAIEVGHVTIGQTLIQVNNRGIPGLQFLDLGVFDGRGAEVVRLNNVGAHLSPAAVLEGRLTVRDVQLNGAQMTLRRLPDGQFDLSFAGAVAVGTLPGILDIIDKSLGVAPLDQTQEFTAQDLTIHVEDMRSGRFWQVTDGRMQLMRMPDGLDITVAFDVFNGTEDLAEVVLGAKTNKDTSAAFVGGSFENALTTDIALQSPILSFLSVLNAPINGALRAEFQDNGDLSSFAGSLEIDKGALQPTADTKPIGFEDGKAYFKYDPLDQMLSFSEVSVTTEAGSAVSSGHAYLRDFKDGWPQTMLAQYQLSDLKIEKGSVFDTPVTYSKGAMDIRMQLAPFSVDFGQVVLMDGAEKVEASGRATVVDGSWDISGDVGINEMGYDRVLSLWPTAVAPNTRKWLGANLNGGRFKDMHAAFRKKPNEPLRRHIGFQFEDADVRFLKTMPHITDGAGYATIAENTFTLAVEQGGVVAPEGGTLDLTGSTMTIQDVTEKPATARFDLDGVGTATSLISLLNQPPFKILKSGGLPVDFVSAGLELDGVLSLPLQKKVTMEDLSYDFSGTLEDVSSDVLVPDRRLAADTLAITADTERVEVTGPATLGTARADATWRQDMGPEFAGQHKVFGTVELSQGFLDEFKIDFPPNTVRGANDAAFELQFVSDTAPQFTVTSDLLGAALSIPEIGWAKPANTKASLTVSGSLGSPPKVEAVDLVAPGLSASGGTVQLNADSSFNTARFSRVKAGDWLDAPVVLTARGGARAPAISVQGGTLDIRKTSFGGGGGQRSRSGGGPMTLSLDRVIVSEGIALTGFEAALQNTGGLSGDFTARLNGGTRLNGDLAPSANGVAVRVRSSNAGGIANNAGILTNVVGGSLDMTLRPQKQSGVYDGQLKVRNTRVVRTNTMAELLNAMSIVGLLDEMNGQGIAFSEIDAGFTLTPNTVRLNQSSAVGPSLGVSLDGLFDLRTSQMQLQGVISPVYFLNGIGQIFSPRSGEGLFGFNYTVSGTSENPKVDVNPLSILTPGMFRDIFRRPPPKVTR
ncbi:MAG: hypothetical protein ACSHXD_02865 [Marinosulfonomonas sp.]